ncbi:MAG TPA: methylated-DNA--[protein]-cysteine S-methyltransferase [Candidatus Acidoferrales bacterium]|nr:methylated-DNA--[protein]-cysteine S-methyltransferase [Candidatus Acidoferrales bacterium]
MSNELLLPTPFGKPLYLCVSDGRVVACAFRPSRLRSAERRSLTVRDPLLREARAQFQAYFRKRLRRFDLPLALAGTPLQVAVWSLVAQLETGELISYADVARAIGSPRAHRGVAAAMARTPYDLLIPAHRVVGSDGTIRGAGPNSLRRRLLAFEGIKLR